MALPLPTGHELVVSAEIIIILFPLRMLLDILESDVRKVRRRIIHRHVHQKHKERLGKCQDAHCTKLQARSGQEA